MGWQRRLCRIDDHCARYTCSSTVVAAAAAAAAEPSALPLAYGAPIGVTERLSAAEIASNVIEPARLVRLTETFAVEGVIIVDGLFPHEVLNRLQVSRHRDMWP